jgi:hypothetical protein
MRDGMLSINHIPHTTIHFLCFIFKHNTTIIFRDNGRQYNKCHSIHYKNVYLHWSVTYAIIWTLHGAYSLIAFISKGPGSTTSCEADEPIRSHLSGSLLGTSQVGGSPRPERSDGWIGLSGDPVDYSWSLTPDLTETLPPRWNDDELDTFQTPFPPGLCVSVNSDHDVVCTHFLRETWLTEPWLCLRSG